MAVFSWSSAVFIVGVTVCLRFGDACLRLALPVGIPQLKLSDRVKTFTRTESKVLHMEADLRNRGTIIYSMGPSLLTTNGLSKTLIAGDVQILGYQEGPNKNAKFRDITGFHQLNQDEVVIADKYNQCLRKVNRKTGFTSTYAGKCGFKGDKDGSRYDARFNHPTGVVGPVGVHAHETTVADGKLVGLVGTLYVADTGNEAIKRIQSDGKVETLIKSEKLRGLSSLHIFAIVADDKEDLIVESQFGFVTTDSGILTIDSKDNKTEFSDLSAGSFPELITSNPRQLLLSINHNESYVFFLERSNYVKILTKNGSGENIIKNMCSGVAGLVDGSFGSCQFDRPSSLLAMDGSLFIGQLGAIRVIPGEGSLYDTPYTLLPNPTSTSIPPPICASHKMTLYLKPGEMYTDASPTPDVNLRLSAGSHTYHDKKSGCTVQIQVIQQEPCPDVIRAVVSPSSGLAILNLQTFNINHRLKLPIGTYEYDVVGNERSCSLKVEIKDYYIVRRMMFSADYPVKCSVIGQKFVQSAMMASANSHLNQKIREICQKDCNIRQGAQAKLTCANDIMTVIWPTDVIFDGSVTEIPAGLLQSLNTRLSKESQFPILNLIVVTNTPPIVYPTKKKNGVYADILLSSSCLQNKKYDGPKDRCI